MEDNTVMENYFGSVEAGRAVLGRVDEDKWDSLEQPQDSDEEDWDNMTLGFGGGKQDQGEVINYYVWMSVENKKSLLNWD